MINIAKKFYLLYYMDTDLLTLIFNYLPVEIICDKKLSIYKFNYINADIIDMDTYKKCIPNAIGANLSINIVTDKDIITLNKIKYLSLTITSLPTFIFLLKHLIGLNLIKLTCA